MRIGYLLAFVFMSLVVHAQPARVSTEITCVIRQAGTRQRKITVNPIWFQSPNLNEPKAATAELGGYKFTLSAYPPRSGEPGLVEFEVELYDGRIVMSQSWEEGDSLYYAENLAGKVSLRNPLEAERPRITSSCYSR